MATETLVHSDLAIPPGEYLEEILLDLRMSKKEFAKRMDRSATKLSAIYKGKKAITAGAALQLERVLGVPAHVWTGLESEYRLTLARMAEQTDRSLLEEEVGLTKAFCYRELTDLGYVRATRNPTQRVESLRAYLGVASLKQVGQIPRYQAAIRQAQRSGLDPCPEALAAWLRIGEREALSSEYGAFDSAQLRANALKFRPMTKDRPEVFLPRLRAQLAQSGVVLVLCPQFPRTHVNGAAFWMATDKAVLMVSPRGKWADTFWFRLCHGLGHLLLHGRREVHIESSDGPREQSLRENEANRFAADSLIPRAAYRKFLLERPASSANIEKFARDIRVHAGIVVGRMQIDGHIRQGCLNTLRQKYEWDRLRGVG